MNAPVRRPASGVAETLASIFAAAGGSEVEARAIADNLVEATLSGHDSHGVIRAPRYVDWARQGFVRFGRSARVVVDGGAFALLDGDGGFGQTVGAEAAAFGVARARRDGVAVVGLRNAGHLGRIGAWAERACAERLVSIHFCNVKNSMLVAPFGAAGRRMSTAPVAIGAPCEGGDFVLDFATSKIAEGKAMVALRGGTPAPDGALIDGQGRPTADPTALYGDSAATEAPDPNVGPGALAAMGEHKGSGLGLACEILAGALTGSGAGPGGEGIRNGLLSIYLDPDRFRAGDAAGADWAQAINDYVQFVRACPPAAGVERVLIPGDPERARRADRRAAGLPLPPAVWSAIVATGVGLGLDRDRLERLGAPL